MSNDGMNNSEKIAEDFSLVIILTKGKYLEQQFGMNVTFITAVVFHLELQ